MGLRKDCGKHKHMRYPNRKASVNFLVCSGFSSEGDCVPHSHKAMDLTPSTTEKQTKY